uniref:Uncharacterized protein n=1 Tax=Glossina pallidipes TaxID=7398 RepID=A0A1B0A145_GLOPL
MSAVATAAAVVAVVAVGFSCPQDEEDEEDEEDEVEKEAGQKHLKRDHARRPQEHRTDRANDMIMSDMLRKIDKMIAHDRRRRGRELAVMFLPLENYNKNSSVWKEGFHQHMDT